MQPGNGNAATERWLLRIRGRVQGVGFREACVRHAQKAGIKGWVRNRSDGSVEATLEGPPDAVAAMSAWLRDGVPGALVTTLEATQLTPPWPALDRFERLTTL